MKQKLINDYHELQSYKLQNIVVGND